MKKIVLTGGGTAGHVQPNIALIPRLKELGYDIHYVGSYTGIEKKLITDIGIPYYPISTGKLRRYFDWKNFSDPFRVIKGFSQSKKLLKELKPDVVFSEGGFVGVPVVYAASHWHIPVIIHESGITPGLANKLSLSKATRVCCNFPETQKLFPDGHAVVTGNPIRQELFDGNAENAFKYCGFTKHRPTILVVGGSSGAAKVNQIVWDSLNKTLETYNVIHLTGKGKSNPKFNGLSGYSQFEYIKEELPDMFALADVVISRAGANAICELLALHKPNILIPLSSKVGRGDQEAHAASFEKSGYSKVILEESLSVDTFLDAINDVMENKYTYITAMSKDKEKDSITLTSELIEEVIKENSKK